MWPDAQLADRRDMISALQRLKAESQMPNQMPDTWLPSVSTPASPGLKVAVCFSPAAG